LYESDLYRNFGKVKPSSIAVIGDVILDHYLRGEINRVSPEAPVGILSQTSDEYRLGGAANVACNLAKLGCSVSLVGMIGKDESAKQF
jgi:bifunctional ADP-heptose synthase (sugar kinase/adenylyltransferase)